MHHFLRPFSKRKPEIAVMLSTHMAEAEKQRQLLQPSYALGAKNIEQAAHKFSDTLLTAVNNDVSKAYQDERQIETQLRDIERLMSTNATQIELWNSLLDRLTTELMEMGDITNWLQTLDKSSVEIQQLCESIMAKKKERRQQ